MPLNKTAMKKYFSIALMLFSFCCFAQKKIILTKEELKDKIMGG